MRAAHLDGGDECPLEEAPPTASGRALPGPFGDNMGAGRGGDADAERQHRDGTPLEMARAQENQAVDRRQADQRSRGPIGTESANPTAMSRAQEDARTRSRAPPAEDHERGDREGRQRLSEPAALTEKPPTGAPTGAGRFEKGGRS
jgi:hypothetical protein